MRVAVVGFDVQVVVGEEIEHVRVVTLSSFFFFIIIDFKLKCVLVLSVFSQNWL